MERKFGVRVWGEEEGKGQKKDVRKDYWLECRRDKKNYEEK